MIVAGNLPVRIIWETRSLTFGIPNSEALPSKNCTFLALKWTIIYHKSNLINKQILIYCLEVSWMARRVFQNEENSPGFTWFEQMTDWSRHFDFQTPLTPWPHSCKCSVFINLFSSVSTKNYSNTKYNNSVTF